MIQIKSDKIITPSGLFDGYLYIENGKISNISDQNLKCDVLYDYTGKYVSPGFIDSHTHGAGGHAFINSTVEDVISGCNFHFAHGTTSIMPTVSAGAFEAMKAAVVNISKAKKSPKVRGNILGAHLEGPYLSVEQCGAQCPDFITNPIKEDYVSLIKEYGKDIGRWTFAPEKDLNGEFCKYLTSNNILASAGHTNATYDEMRIAIDNGCTLVTHLYSSMSTITRHFGFRRLGVIESAFLRDDLFVEIIADGKHLPPELIKMILKIKGTDKTILTTDSLEVAGTDVKEGVMSGTAFIVEDGICKLKDRSAFAGSVALADNLIRVMINECGVDIIEAVKMFTQIPAKILKLNKGSLEKNKDADIIIFDKNIKITDIFLGGIHTKNTD